MPLWTFLIWGVTADWWTAVGGTLILFGLLYRYLFLDLRERGWKGTAQPPKLGH